MEPGVARVQAAGLNPEIGIVVVHKDNLSLKPRGKADGLQRPEGNSPIPVKPRGWDTTGV